MFCFTVPSRRTLVFAVVSMVISTSNMNSAANPPPLIKSLSERSPFDVMLIDYRHLPLELKTLLIMEQYCGRLCNSILRLDDRSIRNTLCALCYCDDDCYMYGDCCPDKYVHDNRTRVPSLDLDCVGHNLKSEETPWYYMIPSCPQSATDDALVAGCLSNRISSITDVIPVTDEANNITYRNRYCAECNDVFEVKRWGIKINCIGYSVYDKAESLLHLYQLALTTENCTIILRPNLIPIPRECSKYGDTMIDKCNVTGKWRIYEEKIVEACNEFFYPIKKGGYRNVFCYVCNVDLPWHLIMMETDIKEKFDGFALTALFDFDDSETIKTEARPRCPTKEFYDSYNRKCRKIVCPRGKILKGKECISLLQESEYFRYIICLDITIQMPVSDSWIMTDSVFIVVSEELESIISKLKLTLSVYYLDPFRGHCDNNTVVVNYIMEVLVYAKDAVRDDLEKSLSDIFNNKTFSSVHVDNNQTTELSISDRCSARHRYLARDVLLVCGKQYVIFSSKGGNHLNGDLNNTLNNENVDEVPENQQDNNFYADLIISDMLSCAQVELNSTEYSLDVNSRAIVLEATNETLTQLDYQMTDREIVRVCLFHLQNDSLDDVIPPNVPSSSTGIMSLVCTCISLTFLLISVIVYVAIPHLRTSVSKYNLSLALNLIAAQTLFEFGAEQIQLNMTCQIIGIIAHYFWLSSVFWMNACTFNLFYRICFPFRSRAQSEMKIFLLLCLYSFISPGIIVIITILSNYFVLGVSGYGHNICYLSSANSRKYAFAVPIGILVCVNILLFFYTIISICRLPKLKSTSDNRVSLIMCVNLSTITGASWVFGYLYEASGFISFAYIFSIFLGSIGLFLFLSFFAVRLRKLLLCNCCAESVNGSPSTSTAMVSVSTEGTGHI